MENPRARLTNVHQIEGVLFVQWATYTDDPAFEDGSGSHDGAKILAAAEASLRKDGSYVLLDRGQEHLWHFVFAGSGEQDDSLGDGVKTPIIADLTSHGLKNVSSGILRTSDIADAMSSFHQTDDSSDTDSEASGSIYETNHSASAIPASFGSHPHSPRHIAEGSSESLVSSNEILNIYHMVTAAVEKTVGCAGSSKGIWLPISPGLYSCDDLSPMSQAIPGTGSNLPYSLNMSCLFKLRVTWLTSGLLVLHSAAVGQRDPKFAHLLADDDSLDGQALLCPFGLKVEVILEQESGMHLKNSLDKSSRWRENVLKWLEKEGITLNDPRWWTVIRTNIQQRSRSGNAWRSTSVVFSWPRDLCYDLSHARSWSHLRNFEPPPEGIIRDVLTDTESWKLNKDQRSKDVNQQRMKKKESASQDEVEEDYYVHIFPKSDGRLDVQALTGIYPTPPGAKPQGMAANDDRIESKSTYYDAKTPGETETKTPRVTFEDQPELESMGLEMETFDHIEEDDLFGNLPGGEYGNNGVTEDDFSFFDEPGDTPMEGAASISSVPDLHEPEVSPFPATSPEIHEKAEKLVIRDSDDSSPERINLGPVDIQTQQDKITAHEASDNMDWQYSPNESSTLTSSVQRKNSAFEQKYGSKGKFSTAVSDSQATASGQEPEVKNQIPSLPTMDEPSDSDDDSESSASSDLVTTPGNSLPGIEVHAFQDGERMDGDGRYEDDGRNQDDDQRVIDELELFYDEFAARTEKFMMILKRTPPLFNTKPESNARIDDEALQTNPNHYIRLAQVFTDQMVFYKDSTCTRWQASINSNKCEPCLSDPTSAAINSLFPTAVSCTLEDFAAIGENEMELSILHKAVNRHPIRRTDTGKSDILPPDPVIGIHPPSVRVKRGDKHMEISYVALRFWEDLGLAPFSGPKNITAFCIFPDQEVVRRGARSFLTMMNSTYTSLRLGGHGSGHPAMKGYRDGLIGLPLDDSGGDSSLERTYEKLGRGLQTLVSSKTTIVLYVINDQDRASGTKKICNLFLKLFDSYAGNLRFATSPSDVVLRVLPINWVASSWTVAIPSVGDLVWLSKEIYNRCPLTGDATSAYAAHSLVELAEPVPKSLDFKLTSLSQTNPFHRETYAHVAYCWDPDSSWITAALTDTLGCHCWSASFSMGGRPNQEIVFRAIAEEILAIVADSIGDAHGKVRAIIYKDRAMSELEKTCWTDLGGDSTVLVFLDSSPGVYLASESSPSLPRIDSAQIPLQFPTTPDVPSPDPVSTKQTDELDPNARAIDLDEEAWGVIATGLFGLERSVDPCGHFAHGHIFKRDRAVLGLRVAHTETDVEVRELLTMNQGLICLAKARGLDGELPYHMAIARRAQDEMYYF